MPGRTGIISDMVELDITLSDLERELSTLSLANALALGQGVAANPLALPVAVDRPPAVTGLRLLGNVPGSVTVRWDPVPVASLEVYQLQVSPTLGFPRDNTTNHFLSGGRTRFEYTEGPLAEDLFFRVRARTNLGWGPYSSTVNGRTGEATPNHLLLGATGSLARLLQTEFDPVGVGPAHGVMSAEYGFLELETIGGAVMVLGNLQMEYIYGQDSVQTVRLKEDGQAILEASMSHTPLDPSDLNGSFGRSRFPSALALTAPPPGFHIYSLEMEHTELGVSSIPFTSLIEMELAVLEVRR